MPSEFNIDIQNKGMSICKLTTIKTVSDKITAPVQLHGQSYITTTIREIFTSLPTAT